MRIKFFVATICLLTSMGSFAQSANQKYNLNDMVLETVSQFMDIPYCHYHTKQLQKTMKVLKSSADEEMKYAELFHNKGRISEDKYWQTFYMYTLADVFDKFYSSLVNKSDFEMPGDSFEEFWEKSALAFKFYKKVICSDRNITLYEYGYDKFRVTFAYFNKPLMNGQDFNMAIFNLYDNSGNYVTSDIGGNMYKLIQFTDDEHPTFRNFVKVNSTTKIIKKSY